MNIREIIKIKTGGQWLVSPPAEDTVFCRESFSEEHKDIEQLVLKFASEQIYPNIRKIEKLDEKLKKHKLIGGRHKRTNKKNPPIV